MQLRGPALKGAYSYGLLFLRFSGRNRSGLNTNGFSNALGLWPIANRRRATLDPLGMVLPLATKKNNL